MEEELNKVIDEEKRDGLIKRINELYDEGILKIRDWMAIYDVFIAACNRETAESYEKYVIDSIGEGSGDAE